ncbi:sulfatase family protein [Rhizobium binxianense]
MRPNILLIFPDQWRGDWIGANAGLPLRTPNIDLLLARGVGFGRAWTPSPLCAPARSCLACGKAYDRAPVQNNSMDNPIDLRTFYRELADGGYQVANIGKSDLLKGGDTWGVDGRHVVDGVDRMSALGFSHGFDSAGKHAAEKAARNGCREPYTHMLEKRGLVAQFLDDFSRRKAGSTGKLPLSEWLSGRQSEPPDAYANVAAAPLPPDAYNDNFVGEAAVAQLSAFDESQPWFLIVNFPGPHEPVDVTPDMIAAWDSVDFPLPYARDNVDADRQRAIRRRYAAMLENIDRWVGRLCDTLAEKGQSGNTVVVFASDHGEMLGDRNLWKKQVPFEPSVHVPMIIAGPGVRPQGLLSDRPASLLDLPATFLSLAGLSVPADWDGLDLADFLRGKAAYPRDMTASGLGGWRAICDGRYKLVVGFDPSLHQEDLQFGSFNPASLSSGQLFDLNEDPFELHDLWHVDQTNRERLLLQLTNDLAAASRGAPTFPKHSST